MKYIGLDVGNGTVAMCIKTLYGPVTTDIYSSVYGRYESHAKLAVGGKHRVVRDIYSLDDDYVLGSSAIDCGVLPILAYDREDRYSRPEFQTLVRLALMDAATKDGSTGTIEVELGVGTPAEDYRSDVIAQMQNWFSVPVKGKKNGSYIEVRVGRLEVASQPIAVFADGYLDTQGYVRDPELERSHVLVIDSGSGTLDLTELKNMELVKQISEPVGMNDVYSSVIEEIQKQHPKVRTNVFDIEHQLRPRDSLERRVFTYGRLSLDVTELYQATMMKTWERMVGLITQRFPDRLRMDKLILAGGTGQAFEHFFRAWMPEIFIPPQADLAIARGLCKQVLANTEGHW